MALTEKQHEGICILYDAGMPIDEIALLYGVSLSQVVDIVKKGQSK